jgi:hypothetical protein
VNKQATPQFCHIKVDKRPQLFPAIHYYNDYGTNCWRGGTDVLEVKQTIPGETLHRLIVPLQLAIKEEKDG